MDEKKEIAGFEVSKVFARYRVFDHGTPYDMYVEVYKEDGYYKAQCNYSFWGPEQMGPYQHDMEPKGTPEEALESVLENLREFWKSEFALEQIGWAPRNPRDDVVLGTGEKVPREQFKTPRKPVV